MEEVNLKQLARDIWSGRVVTDRHFDTKEEVLAVFPVLSLMDEETRKSFLAEEPAVIYEYVDQAAPRTVNGMPMFLSFRYLTEDQAKILQKHIDKINEALSDGDETP